MAECGQPVRRCAGRSPNGRVAGRVVKGLDIEDAKRKIARLGPGHAARARVDTVGTGQRRVDQPEIAGGPGQRSDNLEVEQHLRQTAATGDPPDGRLQAEQSGIGRRTADRAAAVGPDGGGGESRRHHRDRSAARSPGVNSGFHGFRVTPNSALAV